MALIPHYCRYMHLGACTQDAMESINVYTCLISCSSAPRSREEHKAYVTCLSDKRSLQTAPPGGLRTFLSDLSFTNLRHIIVVFTILCMLSTMTNSKLDLVLSFTGLCFLNLIVALDSTALSVSLPVGFSGGSQLLLATTDRDSLRQSQTLSMPIVSKPTGQAPALCLHQLSSSPFTQPSRMLSVDGPSHSSP